jgi:cell division protein FtsI (penicillin-binding protein 3)
LNKRFAKQEDNYESYYSKSQKSRFVPNLKGMSGMDAVALGNLGLKVKVIELES